MFDRARAPEMALDSSRVQTGLFSRLNRIFEISQSRELDHKKRLELRHSSQVSLLRSMDLYVR